MSSLDTTPECTNSIGVIRPSTSLTLLELTRLETSFLDPVGIKVHTHTVSTRLLVSSPPHLRGHLQSGKFGLRWESFNGFNKVLVAVPVTGQELSHERDHGERVLPVDSVDSRKSSM